MFFMIDDKSIKVMENVVAECFCSLRLCQAMHIIIEQQTSKMPAQYLTSTSRYKY